MKLQTDDIRQIIRGGEELIFLYHKSGDKLFLSKKMQELLGAGEVEGEYWKSSRLWNCITQINQERLVNLIRHEIWNDKSVTYQVPIKLNGIDEHVMFEIELWVIWGNQVNIEIEGIKGVLKRI